MVLLRRVVRSRRRRIRRRAIPPRPPRLKFADRKLAGAVDPKTAGLLVTRSDRRRQARPARLVARRASACTGTAGSRSPNTGLDGLKDVTAVAAGDFDNDGLPDLCVRHRSRRRMLYHNTKGRFENARGAACPRGRFEAAVWLDFDHDYDLDLFLLGAKSVLLRNDGNGAVSRLHRAFPVRRPGTPSTRRRSASSPIPKSMDLAVSYADHAGVLYRDRLRGVFRSRRRSMPCPPARDRLSAVDLDNDGWIDLAFTAPAGVVAGMNRAGKFEPRSRCDAAGRDRFRRPRKPRPLRLDCRQRRATATRAWRNWRAEVAGRIAGRGGLGQADFDGDGRDGPGRGRAGWQRPPAAEPTRDAEPVAAASRSPA